MKYNKRLDEIEELLTKEIKWYMDDNVRLEDKKAKLNISLGANRMINNIIQIEALKQRARSLDNEQTDINRKIERFGAKGE